MLPALPALAALEARKEAAGLYTDAQRSQMFSEMRGIAKARDAAKAAQPPATVAPMAKPSAGVKHFTGRPASGHGTAAFSAGD
jgi:hypothetical protein